MSQNIGVLVPATVRPNDNLDPISVVYTNEARGGHHVYASLSQMYSIIADRRDFGMLATVYNDATASNNKTYQLKYGYSSTASTDNGNWQVFSPSGNNTNSEWINSVIARTNSIPSSNNTGDRYLITGTFAGTSSTISENTWNGHVDNIAQYDSTIPTWNFTLPTEGMTVRVDNEKGLLYKYSGTYSSGGLWIKEYLNQVYSITASSPDGMTYSATTILAGYSKPAVFYVKFGTQSGSPATLNINNLGAITIKKTVGSNLLDIAAGDLNTIFEYQLIYDGTYFQVPFSSATTTIGPAEFGNTYSNGVYSDFTVNTQIGTPIDRFNQLLAELVPPSAPSLVSHTGTSSTYAIGNLSFPSVANFNTATGSPYGNVGIDGLWNIGVTGDGGIYRLGVYSGTTSNSFNTHLSGLLNYNVATQASIPTPAYVAGIRRGELESREDSDARADFGWWK